MHGLQRARLATDISWCQQYAAINRIGLQRLVEQHDRCHDSSAGAAFLEVLCAEARLCISAKPCPLGHFPPCGHVSSGGDKAVMQHIHVRISEAYTHSMCHVRMSHGLYDRLGAVFAAHRMELLYRMGSCKQRQGESHQGCGLNATHATSFLQECSRPGSNVGIFIKTPLLHKVQELQRTLVGPDGDKDQGVLGVLTSRSVNPAVSEGMG